MQAPQSEYMIATTILKKPLTQKSFLLQMITFREFDKDDARKWFPISFLLVLVIYTGSKALVRLASSLRYTSVKF